MERTSDHFEDDAPDDKGSLAAVAREVEKSTTSLWKVAMRGAAFVVITLLLLLAFSSDVLTYIDRSPSNRLTKPETAHQQISSSLDQPLNQLEHSARPATTIWLEWIVSAGLRSPDGVQKLVYLINGAFPGPVLEARSGDVLDILVTNALEDEGLSIHFHGLHMRGYNAMDGAVGFTQNAVAPGESFRYRFKISDDQAGTFWYHAHEEVQRADGIFGPLIVHRPNTIGNDSLDWETEYDEERVIMVNDYYHRPAKEALAWYLRAGSFGMEPVPDSILLNGMGFYNCSNAVPSRPVSCNEDQDIPGMSFDRSRVYRLRVINAGMLAGISIALTGHSMTVVQVDGGNNVVPRTTSSIGVLFPGQRMDVILGWDSSALSSTIKITLDTDAFRYVNAALTVSQEFPLRLDPPVRQSAPQNNKHFDLSTLTSPLLSNRLPETPNQTILLYTKTLKLAHLSNIPHGFLNQTSWKPQSPPLTQLSRSSYDANQFVPLVRLAEDDAPRWLEVVLNNLDEDDHPFHLHGHDAFVLHSYASTEGFSASWNPFDLQALPPGGAMNLVNPVRRDTFVVPRRGYVVVAGAGGESRGCGCCTVMCCCGIKQSGMVMGIEGFVKRSDQ